MTIAIVTGASRGLGRLISKSLADRGIDTMVVGRDRDHLLRLASEIKQASPTVRVAPVQADLSYSSTVDRITSVAAAFGTVDILVNNAAIQGPIGRAWDVSLDDVEETLRVNFTTPSALCRAFIPGMIAKGAGWIVNISGGGASAPRPMFSAYGAAKTALVRWGETVAQECADLGIRINSIAPGPFRSGMTEAVIRSSHAAGEKEATLAERLLKNDSGAAERAAELVTYLVAGEGRDITGKLISAVWDDWQHLHESPELGDLYTLRRIVPEAATVG
jgi:3-oxoacyl-[acyl-carrier protein] reductase